MQASPIVESAGLWTNITSTQNRVSSIFFCFQSVIEWVSIIFKKIRMISLLEAGKKYRAFFDVAFEWGLNSKKNRADFTLEVDCFGCCYTVVALLYMCIFMCKIADIFPLLHLFQPYLQHAAISNHVWCYTHAQINLKTKYFFSANFHFWNKLSLYF